MPVLEHKIPLKAHAHQANDIFNAIRVAKEFGLDITLEHVTEGHLIVDELVKKIFFIILLPQYSLYSPLPGLSKAGGWFIVFSESALLPSPHGPSCGSSPPDAA